MIKINEIYTKEEINKFFFKMGENPQEDGFFQGPMGILRNSNFNAYYISSFEIKNQIHFTIKIEDPSFFTISNLISHIENSENNLSRKNEQDLQEISKYKARISERRKKLNILKNAKNICLKSATIKQLFLSTINK